MIHIYPERYPKHDVKKLHVRTIGSYPILRRLGSNACLIDFAIEYVYQYNFQCGRFISLLCHIRAPVLSSSISASRFSTLVSRALLITLKPPDEILNVLDGDFDISHSNDYRRFLVRWKDRPSTEDAWITKKNFAALTCPLGGLFTLYLVGDEFFSTWRK